MPSGAVTLFLGGDVMLGRGVDQILPHPGDPALWERSVHDARSYIELAEAMNGPIPAPVGFTWPWGDALAVLDDLAPDVRLVNLETAVTTSGHVDLGKGVHYRMNPDNLPALAAVEPDVCCLANNHVLDFGAEGLAETLDALVRAGLASAGAGQTAADATEPAIVRTGSGRVVVFAVGTTSSGVPRNWAATEDKPGVAVLPDLSERSADAVADRVSRFKRPGDIVVLSVHWGSNWGYAVPRGHRRFARRIIDGGVDVVYGHSSHHPRPIELYRDRLILYGCGDLVDDYEGISGFEQFRDDLRMLYLATLDSGRLPDLRIVPLQAHRMRLRLASRADREWSARTLDRVSRRYGVRIVPGEDGLLATVA
jgi:poly-gamma-glutamate synthesis protein (capsule biosynthesis protein)